MEGHWEKDLPKIPVPNLKDTLDRYLAHLKVVIPSSQYEQTRKTVEKFCSPEGAGNRLQSQLIQLADKSENWVNEFWLHDMYLNNPLPLPVNSSPFILFPKQSFRSTLDVFKFSARIIVFTLQFKQLIDKELLSQDYGTGLAKGQPLCMKTYHNFFTLTRIPGKDKDELISNATSNHENHIIVASRNQFFRVNLGNGYEVDEGKLIDQLKLIWYSSKDMESTSTPIGLLTTENRRTWGSLRVQLMEKSTNCSSIESIESSLLLLCLDDSVFGKSVSCLTGTRRDSVEMARMETPFMASQLMHGGGTEFYSANRWYDKFLQIIVSRDGLAGIVFEHSASEGITLIRYADSLLSHLEANPINPPSADPSARRESVKSKLSYSNSMKAKDSISFSKQVKRLTWDLDNSMIGAIKEAGKRLNKLVSDVDLVDLNFTVFGKSFITSQSMSPDAFIQLSLQLTYYKVHRRLVSTYESASLRKYRHGRVDNSRSNTPEVAAWVKVLCDEIPNVTDQQKLDLFQLAIKKQVEIAKYTIDGLGPDNHLLALRELSKNSSVTSGSGEKKVPSGGSSSDEVPMIFKEKSYGEFLNFKLSTSQLTYQKCSLIGYGAVTPEGYGVAYRPTPDGITFCIASFFSSPETGSNYFASSLEGSLLQMRELCLKIKAKDGQASKPNIGNQIKVPMATCKDQDSSPTDQGVDKNNNINQDNLSPKAKQIQSKVINDQLETINNGNHSKEDNLTQPTTNCDKQLKDNKVPNEVVVNHHEAQVINSQLINCQLKETIDSANQLKSNIDNNNNEVKPTIN